MSPPPTGHVPPVLGATAASTGLSWNRKLSQPQSTALPCSAGGQAWAVWKDRSPKAQLQVPYVETKHFPAAVKLRPDQGSISPCLPTCNISADPILQTFSSKRTQLYEYF